MGAAIYDYHKNGKAAKLRVFSSQFDEDEIPVEDLFRSFEDMPELEKAALEAAKAKTKMREADDIAARLSAFLKTHYGDILGKVEDMPTITGAQIVETIDESLKVFQEMLKLKDNLEMFVKNVEKPDKNRPFAVPDPIPAPVDPIMEFLKANKLM